MPNTPVLALPYPSATDTADVPRDIQALAVKLDGYTSLRPPLVTSLPGSPVDGQECYFQADATNGIVWHLRYRAAAAGAYKWEVLGGPALRSHIVTDETTASTAAAVDLATVGPDVTAPLAGDYDLEFGSMMWNSTNNATRNGVVLGAGTTTFSTPYAGVFLAANETMYGSMRRHRVTVPAAGTLLRLRYNISGGTAHFADRYLFATPVRVG